MILLLSTFMEDFMRSLLSSGHVGKKNANNNINHIDYLLHRMTLCGTTEYMAPELMFDEQNYSFEVDIFSLGMVLLEVLKRGKVGHSGFAERNPRTM